MPEETGNGQCQGARVQLIRDLQNGSGFIRATVALLDCTTVNTDLPT